MEIPTYLKINLNQVFSPSADILFIFCSRCPLARLVFFVALGRLPGMEREPRSDLELGLIYFLAVWV